MVLLFWKQIMLGVGYDLVIDYEHCNDYLINLKKQQQHNENVD